jgi:uncharacterized protein (UPF0333 family)
MNKKGQAAMEFLMTYGWAILAAVIAIGVLAYFGVFTPGKYVSGTAIVSAPFYIQAHNVKTTAVNLGIKNNGGEVYNITSITVGTGCATTTNPGIINETGTSDVAVPCTTSPGAVGASFKGDITIYYTKTGSTVTLTSTGTIAEKVTA